MQIMAHIKLQGLIHPRQHGGRKGHSTNTCVLEVLGDSRKAKEDNNLVGILQVDMSSAYDLINHELLLQKLRIMGLAPHTLAWVQNFLHLRSQCMEINGKMSATLTSGTQGVVQGGASSGELFLIYLNDIPECTPRPGQPKQRVTASQYVDDVTLVAWGKTPEELQATLQASYQDMERTLTNHRMILDGGKTQLMILTKKQEHKTITIQAGEQQIIHQDKLKILGINLSSSTKFDDHIRENKDSLVNAIYKKMSILRNVKPHVTMKTLASIGESLIGSTILFGAPIWSQTTQKNMEAVQAAQTKAARMVSGQQSWGKQQTRTHRQEIFTALGWRNVKQLTTSANLNLLKTALEKKTAESINSTFKISIPKNPRKAAVIRVDFVGKANRNCTYFEVQTSQQFNTLPDELRSPLLTAKMFKILIRKHLATAHLLPLHNNS